MQLSAAQPRTDGENKMSKQRVSLRTTLGALAIATCWMMPATATWAGDNEVSEIYTSEPVVPHELDVDMSKLPVTPAWAPGDPIKLVDEHYATSFGVEPDPLWSDPIRQLGTEGGPTFSTTLGVNFGGIDFTGALPPDVVGDVGPNHYIQMVNASRVQIWDKMGNVLAGPVALNTLWNGGASPCTDGDGDPIVMYDRLADRWFLSEFDLTGNTFCFYISQGPDPVTSGWFVYEFNAPSFPDYPQYGVWPDAYYVSSFENPNLGIYAFDRTNMLTGSAATFQRFTIPRLNGTSPRVTRILPSDIEGPLLPPAGAPNTFVRTVDATQDSSNPTDRLEVWNYTVDFADSDNSSFVEQTSVFPSAFTLLPCSPGVRDCIPQPGTPLLLDALFNRAMRTMQYRNFGTHETLVLTQVVDAGSGVAGKRWYELRRVGANEGAGDWTLHQEGTYAPDGNSRFMGAAAMDIDGNIAIGYSISSSTVLPGIRATARRRSDPAGLMTMEELTIIDGLGVQVSAQRWGDYASLNVDPTDDRTFWYTTEYVKANGQWTTHIGSFHLGGLFSDSFESGTLDAWSAVGGVAP